MRLFEDADYDFVDKRRIGYAISGLLIAASLISFIARGLDYGIDFTGGMEFVVAMNDQVAVSEARSALDQEFDATPEVKTFEAGNQLLIRVPVEGGTDADVISQVERSVTGTLASAFEGSSPEIIRSSVVGPRFAEDLRRGAIYAVLGSLFVVFLYVLVRFEWRFSVGACAALVHDVLITVGLFSMLYNVVPFSLQMDQAIIAAFLTIVGYSLNDTVVVFDRVREYVNLFKTETFSVIVNKSINATLSRTVVTSITTLIVVTILFFFGGEVLRGFSFALIIGVIIGTYSSVFVASPTVVELERRLEQAA